MKSTIIVNFGGPRSLSEVEPFLVELLTDRDVVRAPFPAFFHRWFFARVARKRAPRTREDYTLIGGCSPIYADTEAVAKSVAAAVREEVLTFHRYLPATHAAFLDALRRSSADQFAVFPMFPQFSYATTGSVARFFSRHLSKELLDRMCWVKSYADHPAFVAAVEERIRTFLQESGLEQREVVLLFSAHGVPRAFIDTGDIYEEECQRSFRAVAARFPEALSRLCYQSKFGRGEWLRPYTDEVCAEITSWTEGRQHVVLIPISFTSDHIETLFEVEQQYLPPIRAAGLSAYRCPAPNRSATWIAAIPEIIASTAPSSVESLIFRR